MKLLLDETTSTQSQLKDELSKNPNLPSFSYVQAKIQKDGRGRQGRPWISILGNFHCSVLLKPNHSHWTWIPLWVGAKTREALIDLKIPADDLLLKWPNDLISSGAEKLGGILCEKVGDRIIVGIGLNLVDSPRIPEQETASIKKIFGKKLEIDIVRESILKRLHEPFNLEKLKIELSEVMVPDLKSTIEWMDSQAGKIKRGRVMSLGEYGELIAMNEQGKLVPLYSEDVKIFLK